MKYAARMLAVAVMMMPLVASAQLADSHKVVAKVPFQFMAGNNTAPAGEYAVMAADRVGLTLLIRSRDLKTSVYSIVSSGEEQKDGAAVTGLVFHKYGDNYFLAGVELASTHSIYRLPEGKVEAELRVQNVPSSDEVLLVALK